MTKRKITAIVAASVLAVATLVGALTYQNVSAQGTTPTPEAPTEEVPSNTAPQDETIPARPFGMRVEKFGGVVQEDLAAALGIDVEALEAAQQTATEQALAQAVEQGLITQAQADRMLERELGRGGKFGVHLLEISGIDYDALLADALNVSVEELEAARDEAFNTGLERAVDDGALTQEQADLILGRRALFGNDSFQTSMQSAFTEAVQQAVTDGVITQAQADAILQSAEERGGLFGFGGRGDRGFFGGRHGGRGGRFFQPSDELPAIEPSPDA